MFHDEARVATPRTLRWGAMLLWPMTATATALGVARWRCGYGRDEWGTALLALAALGVVVGLALFARDLRAEVARTARPWWRTPLFVQTALLAGVFALPGLAIGATARMEVALGVRTDPLLTATIVLAVLLLMLVMTSVVAVDSILRRGGDLLHGSPEQIGVDGWCRSRLGVWWIGRAGVWAIIAAVSIASGKPFGFPIPFFYLGLTAAVEVGHALNLNFSFLVRVRERARTNFLKTQALQASAAFRQLERRNAWIEIGTLPVFLLGAATPYLVGRFLQLYGDYDPRVMWLLALMFGLMITAPAAFVLLATLGRGRFRFAEFQRYWAMKYDYPLGRMASTVGFFTALTIVGVIGVAMTADFSRV